MKKNTLYFGKWKADSKDCQLKVGDLDFKNWKKVMNDARFVSMMSKIPIHGNIE